MSNGVNGSEYELRDKLDYLQSFLKCDISHTCEDYGRWEDTFTTESCCPCKALTNECIIMRDMVFYGYTKGQGEPYEDERPDFEAWMEVYG